MSTCERARTTTSQSIPQPKPKTEHQDKCVTCLWDTVPVSAQPVVVVEVAFRGRQQRSQEPVSSGMGWLTRSLNSRRIQPGVGILDTFRADQVFGSRDTDTDTDTGMRRRNWFRPPRLHLHPHPYPHPRPRLHPRLRSSCECPVVKACCSFTCLAQTPTPFWWPSWVKIAAAPRAVVRS